jgi:hypothetical protein
MRYKICNFYTDYLAYLSSVPRGIKAFSLLFARTWVILLRRTLTSIGSERSWPACCRAASLQRFSMGRGFAVSTVPD